MRALGWIGMIFVCFVAGGATCGPRQAPVPFPPPPVVLNEAPTIDQLTPIINRAANIRQLSSNSATVTVLSEPKLPRLTNSTLHLQRDRMFRLQASLPIVLGAGVDMGSNDEVFWFEVPEGIGDKTLYYARHEQYQQQLNRAVLPVDPTWVMDALGLIQIDRNAVVAGPIQRSDGKLEVRSTLAMPDGIYQRVCLIEPRAGYVTDQLLYAPAGNLIAQSHATNHVYYDEVQCALPHQVEITLSPIVGQPLSMRIEVGSYAVNQLLSGDPNLFVMPQSASRAIDLTTLSAPPATAMVTPPAPVGYSATISSAYPLRGTLR